MSYTKIAKIFADSEALSGQTVSVGGWVMEQLNRVPIKGDSFTAQNLEITVSDLSAYRVSFITVRQCNVCLTCEQ